MKKNKLISCLSLCAAFCFSLGMAACDNDMLNQKKELSGFEVVEEVSAELGSVYTIPMPLVSDQDRKVYDVEVSVEADGEAVQVIGGMFEVTKTTNYVLTYTLRANGTTQTKVSTLTVADTQGPAIDMDGVKAKGSVGDVIDLSSITAEDYSGVKDLAIEVKFGTESVAVNDNKFTFDQVGRYVVKATATDNNNVVSERSYLTECLADNQLYTFNTEQVATKFGSRYASMKQISDGPNNALGCLKLVPTQGWFYMSWSSIGFNEKYDYDLTKVEYDEYAYVVMDVYFETEVASAIVYDFNNSGTTVETNKWVSVTMPKEKFNNGTQAYTPMWSSVAAKAVYVDNIRLEKVSPMVYDFEGNNVAGQFGSNQGTTSMAKDPTNESNNVLKWDVTKQWASLNFWNFNKEHLSSKHYSAYHEMSFKIYVEDTTVTQVSLGVFITETKTQSIPTNEWVTVSVPIKTLLETANAKYVCVWKATAENWTIYFDDIQVKSFDGVLYDFDQRGTTSTLRVTGGHGTTDSAVQTIVDNPYVTETNLANKVLKIDGLRPTICIYFDNLAKDIATWQSITGLAYTRLTFDIYVDVDLDGEVSAFDGFDAGSDWDASGHGVEYGKWITITVDLTTDYKPMLMMWWNDEAATKVGSVYIDNVNLHVN